MIDDNAPATYLNQPPTDEEHLLAEQCDKHDGDSVPFWMLAKVAGRVQRGATWQGKLDAIFARARLWARVALSAAAANLAGVGLYWLHAHDAAVAAGERAAAGDRAFEEYRRITDEKFVELRLDIRELRAALHRLTGVDPLPLPPNSDIFDPETYFDMFSSSGPASGGANGTSGVCLQRPPLQNRHTFPNPSHSAVLEQMFRHPAAGLGCGCCVDGDGLLLQAAIAATMTSTMTFIPRL